SRRSRDLRAGSVFLWWTLARGLDHLQTAFSGQIEIWLPRETPEEFRRLAQRDFAGALSEPYGLPHRASGWCPAEEDNLRRVLGRLGNNFSERFCSPVRELPIPGSGNPVSPG